MTSIFLVLITSQLLTLVEGDSILCFMIVELLGWPTPHSGYTFSIQGSTSFCQKYNKFGNLYGFSALHCGVLGYEPTVWPVDLLHHHVISSSESFLPSASPCLKKTVRHLFMLSFHLGLTAVMQFFLGWADIISVSSKKSKILLWGSSHLKSKTNLSNNALKTFTGWILIWESHLRSFFWYLNAYSIHSLAPLFPRSILR